MLDYKFILYSARCREMAECEKSFSTTSEMIAYAEGILFGIANRLKYCYVEIYDVAGRLITTIK